MALMSGKVYSNTGAPSNADGVDGDIYLRLDGMKTTYRKESGAWVAVGSTLGAIPEFISGVGAPNNALGVDEQYYRDTSNQNIYYKQGSTWNLVGNLTGASFGAVLDQAGIGKDLATAPNLINSGSLNAVTTVGEYYYTNAVTDTPSPYGLMKVWRESSTYIYQLVQSAGYGGKLYNRYSGDGGTNWGSWIEYASTSLATTTALGLVEKATQSELNTGVANVWPDAQTILNGLSLSAASTGYFKFPDFLGSLVVQWGYNSNTTDAVLDINFPTPFINPPFIVLATGEATSNPDRAELITVAGFTNSKFTWYGAGANPSGTISEASKGYWLAIGK